MGEGAVGSDAARNLQAALIAETAACRRLEATRPDGGIDANAVGYLDARRAAEAAVERAGEALLAGGRTRAGRARMRP